VVRRVAQEVVAVTTYHVRVERGDRYWLVHVVELDRWTQARTLRDVEPMARDLIATMVGVKPDSVELATDIALPDKVTTHLKQAEQLREQSRQAQANAATEVREAARLLSEQGMSLRDVGAALGVSYQRVHQLLSS
jgi:DNA-directed RNA polymerase specialized sigma24 family protein